MSLSFATGAVSMHTRKKSVTGSALVFPDALDMGTMIDPKSGKIMLSTHESTGSSIKNKIVLAPRFSYNLDLEYLLYLLAINEVKPKAIIVHKASSNLVLGSVMADIPLIYDLPEEVNDLVKNGDRITIDFDNKEIHLKNK